MEHFTRQAFEALSNAQAARLPENVQALAEEGVVKAREAHAKFAEAAKDGVRAAEEVMRAAQGGGRAIGEQVLDNARANAAIAFDAAQAIARAKTIPEAARLQANYMQRQLAIASEQTKDLFELATRVGEETFDAMNKAATKSFEQFNKVS